MSTKQVLQKTEIFVANLGHCFFFGILDLVGGFNLFKNMRKSNWIIFSGIQGEI